MPTSSPVQAVGPDRHHRGSFGPIEDASPQEEFRASHPDDVAPTSWPESEAELERLAADDHRAGSSLVSADQGPDPSTSSCQPVKDRGQTGVGAIPDAHQP